MRILMMLTGFVAKLLWKASLSSRLGCETDEDRWSAEALAAMRDANITEEEEVELGGCYHNGVAYSLAYDANGVVELCGKTFTNLDTGLDGGATAALHRHRQNYDPSRDVKEFIVALKPVKVIKPTDASLCEYGLPPGPLVGGHPTAEVWGEHVAQGRFNVVKNAVEQVKQDCERRGINISKSLVTVSVNPHDGQEAFARCATAKPDRSDANREAEAYRRLASKARDNGRFLLANELDRQVEVYEKIRNSTGTLNKKCDQCSCPECECDGTCDEDYATSCHRCDTWTCSYCVVDGACHTCFGKMQGGVN